MSTNTTVITPIHLLDEVTKQTLLEAIKSVEEQTVQATELLLVVSTKDKETLDYVNSLDFGDFKDKIRILENAGADDFASQINLGVNNITTDWFTILEFDDQFSKINLKNAVIYRESYPEVKAFLNLIVDVNSKGEFMSLSNEAVWAKQFCDVQGYLDNNALLAYQNFNIDGIFMNKETYLESGGLKSNIKLTFPYEFLLRLTYKDVKIMTIPKIGYKHMNLREGSLFDTYKKTMTPDESNWWLAQAKKEYFFNQDRVQNYNV